VIERPAYDLTLFKVHFGLLTLKGYTKGERVLRFEAIVHNTKTLKTGRALENFPATITALLTLRDHVIAPILAGIRVPRRGRPPAHWTRVDRDYQTLQIGMQTLFRDLGIETLPAAA
jgi:hypothetical protein